MLDFEKGLSLAFRKMTDWQGRLIYMNDGSGSY